MKKTFTFILLCICLASYSQSTAGKTVSADSLFPVRGFCIAAPKPNGLDEFVKFIDQELAPRSVNTLILRVDYNFQYESHPELRDSGALSKNDVKKIVSVCRKHSIRVIPQVNLLGHQSWAGRLEKLLQVYPEFDETPKVKMPEKYVWPNDDGLYCKSYCPLHPGVHKVVFELVDEICNVFETDAFHAGMDEVFYLGEDQCPRCSGHDKAELFAGEVRTIRDHLALKGRRLWIWGDRLIDGKTTGIGMWSASMNNTYRAIDMIPKDVMICDWHYGRPEPTAVLFAMKGLDVVECPYQTSSVGVAQVQDMARFRQTSSPAMAQHFKGVVQTVWSGASPFLDRYYGRVTEDPMKSAGNCFKATFGEIQKLTSK
jgi:hypothetical protein